MNVGHLVLVLLPGLTDLKTESAVDQYQGEGQECDTVLQNKLF